MHRRRRSHGHRGGAGLIPIDPAIHQQLAHAVERCGVRAGDAEISYEDYLQSEQIVIKSKTLSNDEMACIGELRRRPPYPIIFFADVDLAKRDREVENALERQTARDWLEQRDLLAKLPRFDPRTETAGSFARKIEEFCGIEPGSMLTFHAAGILTLKSEYVDAQLKNADTTLSDAKFSCVQNAISASNLADHGIGFGFVGNAPEEGER